MSQTTSAEGNQAATRVAAYVGSYSGETSPGGVTAYDATRPDHWTQVDHAGTPAEAGYLVWSPATSTLFAVDERKTDGRGPVGPPASVHALRVDPETGALTAHNSRTALGAFPTYLALDEANGLLICVSHGSFDHVERVVADPAGGWRVEYVYDDSTVVVYDVAEARAGVGEVLDVQVLTGHGLDPNSSPQAGGHGQASAHAHCAVIDSTGSHLIVCDKATDRIHVYELARQLTLKHTLQLEPETGPRHAAFAPGTNTLFVTLEFSSELAALALDPKTGELTVLSRCSTVRDDHAGLNEPAEVRVHPDGRTVYVNNRGEDSLAWFATDDSGSLQRQGQVDLATSIHPGLAARSFDFHPNGTVLAVADRPADLVRLYTVDSTGALTSAGQVSVPSPAYVTFAALDAAPNYVAGGLS
jgi:6-phosphogluconolactonase